MFYGSDCVDGASDYKRSVIDPEFAKAAGNVILVELDYPRRTPQALKKQNNELQQAEYKDFQQFILLMV
jgi:protein disulfide-isomerase